MKRMFQLLLIVNFLPCFLCGTALAFPLTQTEAGVTGGTYPVVFHQAMPGDPLYPVPQDSVVEDINTPPSRSARARALNTGILGTSAMSTSLLSSNNLSIANANIEDTLFLSLSNAVPTADGIAILMHLEGSLSLVSGASNPQWATAWFQIGIYEEWNAVRNIRCAGILKLQKTHYDNSQPAYLYAPVLEDLYDPDGNLLQNLFLHPKNSPFFPVNRSGNSFLFYGPMYLIMKGVDPSIFIGQGKEIGIYIASVVSGGAGISDFYSTAKFDPLRPILLYSSTTDSIIYLPEGSTYKSLAGMGIPSTPTEPTPNSPSPNPMEWEVAPFATSPISISMTATTATHSECSPVYYNSEFMDSPTGGSGGQNFDWQESSAFTNTGLQPNHQYGYRVAAAACMPVLQDTVESDIRYAYTLAQNPTPAPYSNKSRTSLRANWTANGNPNWTEYYCENTTNSTNSDWTTNTFWDSTGLTPGATYHFQVKARNGDGRETTTWVDLGDQTTPTTISLYLPLILR